MLLLFIHEGILIFVQIKKAVNACRACVSHSIAFGRRVRLTPVVLVLLLSYYLIHFDVLLLSRWRVYGGSVWFDTYLFVFSPSFLSHLASVTLNCVLSFEKITPSLQIVSLLDLVPLLLGVIFKFEKIISIWRLFSISLFLIFFSSLRFGPYSFDYYFFRLFLKLIFFFAISSSFNFLFSIKLDHHFFNC